ncbi:MAG: histidine phosphatase family protein [Clostridiales bacterium]|jgi:broad specificity phosphatase PhoE|nr:histidine phosphatase family protein [Clostridiales bacterium]
MKLYVTRHGETEWNYTNKILGRTDIPLNEKGVLQAKTLAKNLPKDIELIIASPLGRAFTTAKIIAEENKLPYQSDRRLVEMDFGTYEGRLRSEDGYQIEKRRFFAKYPEGESYLQVAQRVYNFLDEVISKYQGKNILIVAHNGILRVIHTYFNDVDNEDFASYAFGNCEIIKYEI